MTFTEIRNKLLHSTPMQFCIYVELLEDMIDEGGFASLRECLTAQVSKGGCGLEPSKIKHLLYFNPIYKHIADELAIKLQLELVEPLKSQGGVNNPEGVNQHSDKRGQPDNIRLTSKFGTSSDYLAAKIKRDHPDVADKLANGEYRSIHAAALDAGIVTKKYQIEATVEGVLAFCKRHNIILP